MWVPVDVSGITGPYSAAGMLQSFGVRLPEYLMLRAITPTQEQSDWASALSLSTRLPPGKSQQPDVKFDEIVSDVTTPTTRDLCINQVTRFRELRVRVGAQTQCKTPQGSHIPGFVIAATRTLDYGIRLKSAVSGTELTLQIVYPDTVDTSADKVEFQAYGSNTNGGCHTDAATGLATCVYRA